jgi:hypothetical protein
MATAEPPGRQQATAPGAINNDRFDAVLRATRFEAAPAILPQQHVFERRKEQSVCPQTTDQNVLKKVQTRSRFSKPALAKVAKKSFSTEANVLPLMDGRATSTKSVGVVISC